MVQGVQQSVTSSRKGVRRNGQVVIDKSFFPIDARMVYSVLPQTNKLFAGLSFMAAKMFYLLNYRASLNKNHVWLGPNDAKNMLDLSKKEYWQTINELERSKFTESSPCSEVSAHVYCREVLSVPIYNWQTKDFLRNPEDRSTKQLKTETMFIQIPNGLLEDGWLSKPRFSLLQLKVLTKLYEYNDLQRYGGVNPGLIQMDPVTGKYRIGRRLHEDIGATEQVFNSAIQSLIAEGLLSSTPVIVSVWNLMGSEEYIYEADVNFAASIAPTSPTRAVTIIRPLYQLESNVIDWKAYLTTKGVAANVIEQYIA